MKTITRAMLTTGVFALSVALLLAAIAGVTALMGLAEGTWVVSDTAITIFEWVAGSIVVVLLFAIALWLWLAIYEVMWRNKP